MKRLTLSGRIPFPLAETRGVPPCTGGGSRAWNDADRGGGRVAVVGVGNPRLLARPAAADRNAGR